MCISQCPLLRKFRENFMNGFSNIDTGSTPKCLKSYHPKFRSPVCVLLWIAKVFDPAKPLPHSVKQKFNFSQRIFSII